MFDSKLPKYHPNIVCQAELEDKFGYMQLLTRPSIDQVVALQDKFQTLG
jgi:hypothetical protein